MLRNHLHRLLTYLVQRTAANTHSSHTSHPSHNSHPTTPTTQTTPTNPTTLWGDKAQEKVAPTDAWARRLWQSHPLTQAHIRRGMTGDPNLHWMTFLKRRFFATPGAAGLSLGCGEGSTEREAIRLNICEHFTGLDFAPAAISAAQSEAQKAGMSPRIAYQVADLEHLSLTPASYDAIIASHSVHHLQNLEHVAAGLAAALKPNGLLVLNEYVGPSSYQWSDEVVKLMNDLLAIIPKDKRRLADGTYRDALPRPTPEAVAAADPTECLRSQEIIPIFAQHFETIYQGDFGGTLLQFLLVDIIANFHEDNPSDRAMVDLLVYFERDLIQRGVLTSDFTLLVMKPRPPRA